MVTGAWGIRGELKVKPFTDFPERFSPGSVLYLGDRTVRVLEARKLKNGFRVKLDLVTDRAHAESLRGAFLTIPHDDVKPLPEGTYYHFQIIGMRVLTEAGEFLGAVKEVLATGSNDVYVVQDGDKKEILVPALESVVLLVDSHENRMTVRLPEGLV